MAAVVMASRGGERLAAAGIVDQLQSVTHPLHHRAGNEDAALQRIGRPSCDTIGDRGQQPMEGG